MRSIRPALLAALLMTVQPAALLVAAQPAALLLAAQPAALLLAGPAAAQSQQAGVAFDGLARNSDQPVEVTSDELQVDQTGGTAVFTGNVLVTQGEMSLTAPRLTVDYSEGEAGRIERVHATGGVTLVTPTEAAESDEATYTVASGDVLMTGAVLLTQGDMVLSGDRLTIDLETGTGQMQGRVRSVFRDSGR